MSNLATIRIEIFMFAHNEFIFNIYIHLSLIYYYVELKVEDVK